MAQNVRLPPSLSPRSSHVTWLVGAPTGTPVCKGRSYQPTYKRSAPKQGAKIKHLPRKHARNTVSGAQYTPHIINVYCSFNDHYVSIECTEAVAFKAEVFRWKACWRLGNPPREFVTAMAVSCRKVCSRRGAWYYRSDTHLCNGPSL